MLTCYANVGLYFTQSGVKRKPKRALNRKESQASFKLSVNC